MNKEVCKQCVNSGRGLDWNTDDEERWKGTLLLQPGVVCPNCMGRNINGQLFYRSYHHLDEGVPGWCEYVLEHVVLDQ